jgi:hypothetical protein
MKKRRLAGVVPVALGVLAGVSGSGSAMALRGGAAAPLVISVNGSDNGPCTASAPCGSFAAAYRRAQAGQTIKVLAGAYRDQVISVDPQKVSPRHVLLTAAPGAKVVLDKLTVSARHLTIRGLTLRDYWHIDPGAADVSFVAVHTGIFTIRSSSGISVIGGTVGPWDSNNLGEDPQVGDWDRSLPSPSHILIDGVFFHDITRNRNPAAHDDCLQFEAGVDVTIQNNVFTRCGNDADVYIRGDFGPVSDFLIQNNVFGPNESYFSLRLSGQSGPAPPCKNFLVRNNTALVPMWSDCTAIGDKGVRFLGNVQMTQTNYNCSTSKQVGTVWDYNVYGDGVRCGPHDIVGALRLADIAQLDVRPGPTSAAVNHGDPLSFPPLDIRHRRRPAGPRVDAGAYEVR